MSTHKFLAVAIFYTASRTMYALTDLEGIYST